MLYSMEVRTDFVDDLDDGGCESSQWYIF